MAARPYVRPAKRTPAGIVLSLFRKDGLSARALAIELEVNVTTVTRWAWESPRGCGGVIPSRYHRPLLNLAAKRGLKLSANDLVLGRGGNGAAR